MPDIINYIIRSDTVLFSKYQTGVSVLPREMAPSKLSMIYECISWKGNH